MRATLALAVATALVLPGCSTIESIFKPSPPGVSAPPSSSPTAPVPLPPSGPAIVTPTPPKPSTPPGKLPPLQQQMSEEEEQRLRDQAVRQIADADRAMRAVQVSALRPGERETFGTVQSFLQQAQQALSARHYERAMTLARKAEALAQDLPRGAH